MRSSRHIAFVIILNIFSAFCQNASVSVDETSINPAPTDFPQNDANDQKGPNYTSDQAQNASPAQTQRPYGSSCTFVSNSPRYYQVKAEASLWGAQEDVLLNDALVRLLRSRLLLSKCQLKVSEGVPCIGGTKELPCSDPSFMCGSTITVTSDIYDAVVGGDCAPDSPTSDTLVCKTIGDNPEISTAILGGKCRPFCASSSGDIIAETLPTNCMSFQITIDSPTQTKAETVAREISAVDLKEAVKSDLVAFAASDDQSLEFVIVSSEIESALGWGFFPPPPPPLMPFSSAPADTDENGGTVSQSESKAEASLKGVLTYSSWSPCSPVCGPNSISTRTVQCVSADGTILPIKYCNGSEDVQTWQLCSDPCPESYWEYGSWSKCNASCGGGWSTRTATCHSETGSEGCDMAAKGATKIACNTAPCETYSWIISEWGKCDKECGGGQRTRNVTCANARGEDANQEECTKAGLKKPTNVETCNSKPCDFCNRNSCLGRGECRDGQCFCEDGYSGRNCEIAPACNSSVVDSNLACCPSGFVDITGACCPKKSRLDGDGKCCSQEVDVCGKCGGSALLTDMHGDCCSAVDANGICCPSGIVDECGVCDGVGKSCDIALTAYVDVPSSMIYGSAVNGEKLQAFFNAALQDLGIDDSSISIGNVLLANESSTSAVSTEAPDEATGTSTGQQESMQPSPLGDDNQPMVNKLEGPSSDETSSPPSASPATTTTTSSSSDSVPLQVEVVISPNNTDNFTGVEFSSPYMAASLPSAIAKSNASEDTGIVLLQPPEYARKAVCGNQICETGERPTDGYSNGTCPQDCNFAPQKCVNGCGVGGTCLPASGVCECRIGYEGITCETCSDGFVKSDDVCVVDVLAQNIVNEGVIDDDGNALVSGQILTEEQNDKSSTSVGVIVLSVFGALAGVSMLVVAFLAARRYVARKSGLWPPRTSFSPRLRRNPQSNVTNPRPQGRDEEMGLRERFGSVVSERNRVDEAKNLFSGDSVVHVHVDGTGQRMPTDNPQRGISGSMVSGSAPLQYGRRHISQSNISRMDTLGDLEAAQAASGSQQSVGSIHRSSSLSLSYQPTTARNETVSSIPIVKDTNQHSANITSTTAGDASETVSRFHNPAFLRLDTSSLDPPRRVREASALQASVDTDGRLFINPAFSSDEASKAQPMRSSVNSAYMTKAPPKRTPKSRIPENQGRNRREQSPGQDLEQEISFNAGDKNIEKRQKNREGLRKMQLDALRTAVKSLENRQQVDEEEKSVTETRSKTSMHVAEASDHARGSTSVSNIEENKSDREHDVSIDMMRRSSPGAALRGLFQKMHVPGTTPPSRPRNNQQTRIPLPPGTNVASSPYHYIMAKVEGALQRKR